jgi:hypothetical protein
VGVPCLRPAFGRLEPAGTVACLRVILTRRAHEQIRRNARSVLHMVAADLLDCASKVSPSISNTSTRMNVSTPSTHSPGSNSSANTKNVGPGSESCAIIPSPKIAAEVVLTKRSVRPVASVMVPARADCRAACSVVSMSVARCCSDSSRTTGSGWTWLPTDRCSPPPGRSRR